MRTIPSGLQEKLSSGVTTLCRCWRIARRDGVVLGFTDHDEDVTVDGTLCRAGTGLTGSEVTARLGLSVDGSEISGALDDEALSEADLARLGELYERHTVAYRSRDARTSLRLNEEFHFTIYRASAMPILLQILETMWLKVGPSMNLLFTASYDPDWRGGTHHRAMLGAIAAGDPIALEQAVTGDLVDGRARLMPHLPD